MYTFSQDELGLSIPVRIESVTNGGNGIDVTKVSGGFRVQQSESSGILVTGGSIFYAIPFAIKPGAKIKVSFEAKAVGSDITAAIDFYESGDVQQFGTYTGKSTQLQSVVTANKDWEPVSMIAFGSPIAPYARLVIGAWTPGAKASDFYVRNLVISVDDAPDLHVSASMCFGVQELHRLSYSGLESDIVRSANGITITKPSTGTSYVFADLVKCQPGDLVECFAEVSSINPQKIYIGADVYNNGTPSSVHPKYIAKTGSEKSIICFRYFVPSNFSESDVQGVIGFSSNFPSGSVSIHRFGVRVISHKLSYVSNSASVVACGAVTKKSGSFVFDAELGRFSLKGLVSVSNFNDNELIIPYRINSNTAKRKRAIPSITLDGYVTTASQYFPEVSEVSNSFVKIRFRLRSSGAVVALASLPDGLIAYISMTS